MKEKEKEKQNAPRSRVGWAERSESHQPSVILVGLGRRLDAIPAVLALW
jgi:hypothetical protein